MEFPEGERLKALEREERKCRRKNDAEKNDGRRLGARIMKTQLIDGACLVLGVVKVVAVRVRQDGEGPD